MMKRRRKPSLLSEIVRDAVRASGRSQTDIAQAAGVTQSTVSSFLAGGGVASSALDGLAKAVGVKGTQ